jgi:hypothetical protein
MKFYETHFDDYYQSVEALNYHEELIEQYKKFPTDLSKFGNMIIYGPSGVGKYSQLLFFLKNYSPSLLKYEKSIIATIDKQTYIYKISDIHYEIDMSLLGCNSKILWHEIFQQIVDIVSIKPDKHGIIVCKNFHVIHNELLEIFYSYMQQHSGTNNNHMNPQIKIKFILITEHISFIPNNIVNNCYILSIKRPKKELIAKGYCIKNNEGNYQNAVSTLEKIKTENIVNGKEIHSFSMINSTTDLPVDNFNIICDNIIQEMTLHRNHYKGNGGKNLVDISKFRDQIYDILIYNLDVSDCIWYIFTFFINNFFFDKNKLDELMEKMYTFLKQYGNNYRAIFHIEWVLFAMICTFV